MRRAAAVLCQVVASAAAAPARAPARPRPEPGTALIRSHSSSRQSVKHWGKIFCLPEQLLINCPFIDAQDKFCLLSPPPPLLRFLPPPPPRLGALTFLMFTCSGAPSSSAPCGLAKLAHSLYLSINDGDARGTAWLARALCKKADGKKQRQRRQLGDGGRTRNIQERDKDIKREGCYCAQSSTLLFSSLSLLRHAATTRHRFRFVIAQLVPLPGFHISQMASRCY